MACTKRTGSAAVLVWALAASLLYHRSACAGSASWIYDGSGTWSTASRWSPAAVPGTAAGDVVHFTNNITGNRTVTIDSTSRTVGALFFGDGVSPYFNFTLAASGATLTFNNGGAEANLYQTGSANTSDTVSAPVVLADNLNVTNRGALTISGAVSGAGKSLAKSDAGVLTLSGANTYSGGTVVHSGVLSLLKTHSLPGTGLVVVQDAGTLGLGVGGAGLFSEADLVSLFANALPSVSLSANSAVGVDTSLGHYTYASAVPAGSRGFAKLGSNSLILPVANAYSGPTLVYGGVLQLEHANALPGGTATTGGSSALVFKGGVVGLGAGDFTRSLASAGTAAGVNFTGAGGWAAFNADRVVNLGGSGAAVTWGNANTGFNGQKLILGAPTATHTVDLQNPLNLGGSSRTVQVDDGAAAIDAVISAPLSGTSNGNVFKSGAGTLALTAVNTYVGQTWVNSGGTLLLTGAASIGTAGSNTLTLGQQFLGAGTLQYASSATSYFANIQISQSNAATGTLNQTAGRISVSGNVTLSPTADCVSFLNLSGGALAVGGTLAVGLRGNGAGTLTLSGSGTLTAGELVVPDFSNIPGNYKHSYGQYIQNGGTATVGTLVLARTSFDTNPHVGSVDLNGGTFSTASITGGVAAAGGVNTSTFTFNGGTLKPTASSAVFMQGLTAAYVKGGGAVIDTDGCDITIAQPLLRAAGAAASPLVKAGLGALTLTGSNTLLGPVSIHAGTLALSGAARLGSGTFAPPVTNNGALVFLGDADQTLSGLVTGAGSLTQNGGGTLTLSGCTPYAGATTVNAGTLRVVSGGSLSNSAVTLASGAALRVQVVGEGSRWSCKALTLGGGAVTVDVRLHGAGLSETDAPLLVDGDLVNDGTLDIAVNGALVAAGTYPLIRYGGALTGVGSLGAVSLPNGGAGTLVHNSGNKTVDLVVSSAVTPLVWNGGSGAWDIGATANWTGLRTTYQEGDLVLFDDTSSGTAPYAVALAEAVSPNSLLVDAAKDYALAGPGSLSGEADIRKKGPGALVLACRNTSSGGLFIDGGSGTVTATLAPGGDGLGTGPVSIGGGSSLVLDNTNTTAAAVAKANPVSGSGSLKVVFATNTTGRATTLSGLSGFAGTLQVGGAGAETGDKLDVSGADAPGASVLVSAGHTLQVGGDGAPVRFGGLAVSGSGNAESRGALRLAGSASLLEAPITLLGDATFASDAPGATLSGPVVGTAPAGATNVLTQGTAGSAAGFTLAGAVADGPNGGRLALVHCKGTLTLSGSSTYGGGTTVNGGGTLRLGRSDALPVDGAVVLGGTNGVGSGVGNLALGEFSQTLDSLTAVSMGTAYNTVTVAPGQTLAVSGAGGLFVGLDAGVGSETRVKMTGGGALALTHPAATVTLGKSQSDEAGTGSGVLDLSELSSVTLGSEQAPIHEVRVAYGQMSGGTLTLSNTSNLLAAATLYVGNSLRMNAGSGTLILGAGANVLAADAIAIGLFKGVGTVRFASQAPGSPGTVTVRGRTQETADIVIGSKGAMASGAVPNGTLDLRGHDVDVAAGAVTIGREDNSSGAVYTGGAAGSLYVDGGSFSVTNLLMAYRSGVNTGVNAKATATLTVGGGVFTVRDGGAFTFATQTGTGTANATLNLNGGTFRSYADILTGPSNCTSAIHLNGGTLDMTRRAIGQGAQTVTVFNAVSGTLMNLGEFNNGAPLVKSGSGTLTLDGTNTFSGVTVVGGGVLRLTGGACLPPTAELHLAAGAACQLDYAGALPIRALVIDGVPMKGSLYGQEKLPAYFSGSGYLQLPPSGSLLQLR